MDRVSSRHRRAPVRCRGDVMWRTPEISFAVGGFVGVDVFFVISGYVVANILARELSPELEVLRAPRSEDFAGAAGGYRDLLRTRSIHAQPGAFQVVSRSAAATVLFASNIWFFRSTEGYFGEDATPEPLLHTWSLGIEERFFIIFPLLLLAIHRFAPRRPTLIVLCIVMVSLLWAAFAVFGGHASSAFFLLASRPGSSASAPSSRWQRRRCPPTSGCAPRSRSLLWRRSCFRRSSTPMRRPSPGLPLCRGCSGPRR